MTNDLVQHIQQTIRTIPDWPQAGVQFRDITPVLADPKAFRALINIFTFRYMKEHIDIVAGVDARGFIIGSVLAYELNVGFVPIRKKGKLPYKTISQEYSLEYGQSAVEIHTDAIQPGQRVLLIDDLVATGGTLLAAVKLLKKLDAHIVEAAAIIDLPELGGADRIKQEGVNLFNICAY